MNSSMNHWERIRAAIKGEETDRVPISLWRHWPTHEESPQALAASTIRWQREYDFDLIKVTPMGTYAIEDWGAQTFYNPNPNGVRTVVKHAVSDPEEYPNLKHLDVNKGCYGRQLKALDMIVEEFKDNPAPILMTVFSPLTVANKLVGDRVYADMRLKPELLEEGLRIIAEVTADYSLESIRRGAHGLFFACQADSYRLMDEAQYRRFGEVYDRMVLDKVRQESELILLHAHGFDIMFDLVANYPIEAINWHDRITSPSLAEALGRFEGMLVGGINEWVTMLTKGPEEVQAEIHEAIEQTTGLRLMVGPGCVIPINVPVDNIVAARKAVNR
jgi:uroporphyrinogen decarboxylase